MREIKGFFFNYNFIIKTFFSLLLIIQLFFYILNTGIFHTHVFHRCNYTVKLELKIDDLNKKKKTNKQTT